MPKVSVIMPVYKETVALITRSIESLLNQTFGDFELLITVDCPTNEDGIRCIQEYSTRDGRIIYTINETNIGQGASRNEAIKRARGEYIALHDGDDISLPDRLSKQVNFLDTHPDVGVVGSGLIYQDLNSQKVVFRRSYNELVSKEINRIMPCGHPSIMARKSVYETYGFYDTQFSLHKGEQAFVEDYDLFIRWYIQGVRIRNLQEYLVIYSRDGTKIPKAKPNLKCVIQTKRKYIHHLHFGIFDHFYLYAQVLLSLFPSKVIAFLFYKLHPLK